jgi:hypothetical protein
VIVIIRSDNPRPMSSHPESRKLVGVTLNPFHKGHMHMCLILIAIGKVAFLASGSSFNQSLQE